MGLCFPCRSARFGDGSCRPLARDTKFWLQTGHFRRRVTRRSPPECYLAPISNEAARGVAEPLTEETLHTKHTLRGLAALAAAGLALTACGTTD